MMKSVKKHIASGLLSFTILLTGVLWTNIPMEAGMIDRMDTIATGSHRCIRFISEHFNAHVGWDEETRTITIEKN